MFASVVDEPAGRAQRQSICPQNSIDESISVRHHDKLGTFSSRSRAALVTVSSRWSKDCTVKQALVTLSS